ncbi:sigma-70 family RNA polymerase sigma factor [Streptomyces sp. NPDC048717]|uniref:sigma-70 family RNA polymerase sigma factor n=1 Tax=Streptomyces sp. NPDC048717 TaxID=3154928 RepID=UPI0034371F82
MSGDSRDETLGATGRPDGAAAPATGQVPSQGGPARAPGLGGTAPAPSVPTGFVPGSSVPLSSVPAGSDAPTVPQQRANGGTGAGSAPSASSSASDLPPSDADLVRRMREGDDDAYGELYRRHHDAVRRYARSCCRDADTAEDLTAEVFAGTLQAVRRGAGPEQAVRAYLLTSVRRVAASWTRTRKREQLIEDFALFAEDAARSSEVAEADALDLGADVRAMHLAERSLALQAFRSLPERWQAVLWHTTVEEESPSAIAPLFGLTANATAVLAGRAREGLKQAYLQAHVSQSLTTGGDCARYADRLGAYARGGLRTRAERGLRKHLAECAQCRLAAGELAQVNAGIPALLPVAVIGWFAAGYTLKAAGVVAGGVAGAGAAGAAAAATGAGAGAGAGASGGAGASSAAAAEGLGVPAKAGIAAVAAVAASAGLVWALTGSEPQPVAKPAHAPKATAPVKVPPSAPAPKPTPPPAPAPPADAKPAAPDVPAPSPTPSTKPTPSAKPAAKPKQEPARTPSAKPAPRPTPSPKPPSTPAPTPTPPKPAPTPTPPKPTTPPEPPAVFPLNQLEYGVGGDGTKPEIDLARSSWLWQHDDLSMNGVRYSGVSVAASSSVHIDLNRRCTRYDALAGIDDLAEPLKHPGGVRFSVYADGERLWRSPVLRPGDTPVPVRLGLTGRSTLRLVVEPHTKFGRVLVADWADSRISCAS